MTSSNLVKIAAATLATSAALALSACGSSDDSSKDAGTPAAADNTAAYCSAIKDAAPDLASFASTAPDLSRFHALAGEVANLASLSPANMKATWEGLNTPISSLDKLLSEANTDLVSYATALANGGPPEGVTADQAAAITPLLAGLQDPRVMQTSQAIATDAKTTCSVDIVPAG